ncbi:high-affinity choline transporter 1-like isoform X1 [Pocillopora damicornis]|uniref:high-affinity choline transporter 1-like isoform X1 n=1 Tax=Pocillopora damicornis TaxID=46731 RepID=UPI000F553E18|nr:high-affinity choline transporter 1-like isoform X1 [Pocillopora damicornis]
MAEINIAGAIAIVLFYLVILGIGLWAVRGRRRDNEEEAMLAGRSLGLVIGTLTLTATWVGGGYINGTAEVLYDKSLGLVWAQAPWCYAISLGLGGLLFAKVMRERKYVTMIDPVQEKYGAIMGGLLYIPALLGEIFWSGAILSALGATVSVVIGLDRFTSVIVSSCIAIFYTLIGGLYSVVYTDVIQLFCIFIGLWLSIPFAMTHKAVRSISEDSGKWLGEIPTDQIGVWLDYALLLIWGGLPWQIYFQRALSCKSPSTSRTVSYTASIGCLLMAIPAVLIGAIGASTDWTQTSYRPFEGVTTNQTASVELDKTLILPMVLQYLTPPVVSFIGLGAVSAAVMSSTDSSFLSVSTILAHNIYRPIFRKKASEKEVVWAMRVAVVIVGAAATGMALSVESIYALFHLCSDLIYVVLFPPWCLSFFWKDVNTYGSVVGYIVGLLLRVGGGEDKIGFPAFIKYPFYDEVKGQLFPFRTFAMIVTFVILIVVSSLTKYLFEGDIIPLKYDFLNEFKTCNKGKANETGHGPIEDKYVMKERGNSEI